MTQAFHVTVDNRTVSQHRSYPAALRRALILTRAEMLSSSGKNRSVKIGDRHGSTWYFAQPKPVR